MAIRFLAVAAALLLVPATGLAAQSFLGSGLIVDPVDDGSPDPAVPELSQANRAWLDKATKASQEMDEELKTVMSDIANTARMEADPRTKKEQQLQMLEDMLKEYNTENETSIDETSRRMAAIAFRKAVRNHIRRPHRKTTKAAEEPVDPKVAEELNAWVSEANRATHDLEKEVSTEESDLGLAKPKGEEEKTLDRVADLIDEVDPKNASEMANLGDALAQERKRPKLMRSRASRHASQEPTEEDAKMVEAMRAWVLEANKASQDLEKEARHEESDLADAKPKGEEEKSLERVADLIDEVDPKNASEMADLADALAQVHRWPKRKAARQASPDMSEADSKMVEAIKTWMSEANKASQDMEKEARHEDGDLGDAKPKGEEEKSLERVADLIDEVDPKNASEMADLADALAQVHRRPKRKAARQAGQEMSDTDAKVVEAMKNWMAEATKDSQDLEKDVRREESDLGDAKPKGEEERNLDRVADLIDEVDPKNASEMADLADELHQKARTLDGKLKPRAESAGEANEKRTPMKPVLPTFAPYNSEEEADRIWKERLNGSAEAADAMKSWMAEADQANSNIDKEIDAAIDELAQEVPKSDEEKDLDRVMHLIDGTNPENASEVENLAASLARSSSFTRRVGKVPAAWSADQTAWDWTQEDAKKFWSWLKTAEEASSSLDRDLDASEEEFREYLKGMTSKQEGAMHKQLKVLEEMWDKYNFENESATAEDVLEKLDDAPSYTAA
jgi:hypothetical protein